VRIHHHLATSQICLLSETKSSKLWELVSRPWNPEMYLKLLLGGAHGIEEAAQSYFVIYKD
jgi:hypothetical protein